ncbi:MAG: adenylate/guanylate cyclase domain-containing protein [Deltaproteobacteria bacterium]|nr:adenylate/guanylate cyclase domain-containing protein [Deltaproteobacteria bacterium]
MKWVGPPLYFQRAEIKANVACTAVATRADMNIPHEGAAEVVQWMLSDGRRNSRMREFGAEMCRRIIAAGIPIWQGFCFVSTLHPEVSAAAYIFNRDAATAMRVVAGHDLSNSPEFIESPIAEVRRTQETLRRRLCDSDCPLDFSLLQQLKAEGGTDYVAIPMVRSDGETNAITFATDYKCGFTESEIAGLEYVAQALGVIVELQSSRRIAKSLLDTYIGRRTGQRVLSGSIRRGTGETIRAVIWDNDLRGFTALADRLPSEALNDLLNQYFEIMAGAVIAEGGEVLKFIGDGMLAIFEISDTADIGRACHCALRSARNAAVTAEQCNAGRIAAGKPVIRFGIALHLGEVYYGNIGAPGRLDFTVIGPAVNQASRLEKLSAELGRSIVTSASFAAAAPQCLESLGFHQLRGVAEAQELFSPTQEWLSSAPSSNDESKLSG